MKTMLAPTLACIALALLTVSSLSGALYAAQDAARPGASQQNSTPAWLPFTVNSMKVNLLLPDNYSAHHRYPVILYLHQLDMGDWPEGLMQEIDPWFLAPEWRAAYPAIVICPFLDQTADKSGQTINFGGVTSDDQPGQDNAIEALRQVMSKYSCDPRRVYITGNSMGGIGTWDIIIKYNAIDGTKGRVFAAAMPLAGATYYHGYPTPDPAVVASLKNVPIWAIHGAGDNQVPTTWDKAMAAALAGNATFHFTLDPSLQHDVWDTYYPLPKGKPTWDWLFAQKAPRGCVKPIPVQN